MKTKKVTTSIEEITPQIATAYLKHNLTNRQVRNAAVESYALDMRKGHWLLNHQGIAFDESGNLIDGQHRLHAVVMAGVKVPMQVTRGLPASTINGLEIFTMDTVDRGKLRTVGDQLQLRHGYKSAKTVAACANVIAELCAGGFRKLTVPTTVSILEIYGKEIEAAISDGAATPGLKAAPVFASIAFGMKVEPAKAKEFGVLLASGEGIYKSGATSPIFALRRHLLSYVGRGGGSGRINKAAQVLNALKHYVNGEEIAQLKQTSLGIEYFCNRQKSNVSKIAGMLDMMR